MSTIDFNKRAELDITITLDGQGQFLPGTTIVANWTISGTVAAKSDQPTDLTNKQRLRCKPLPFDAIWTEFGAFESVGNQSSFIDTGIRPTPILFESALGQEIGPWTVNEKPILSNNGNVDGELSKKGYYVVQIAEDKTEDDFIELDPPIDGLSKVYPGDLIYSVGDEVFRQWRREPRERWPRPDRTFFWEPNETPFVEEDGKIDGEMAKPGTIILPNKNFDFTDPTKPFEGKYAYSGYGWMFNGYEWRQLALAPFRYKPPKENPDDPDPPTEYRNWQVYYGAPGRFSGCLEGTQRNKPFIYTSKKINDDPPIIYTVTFPAEEGQPPPEPESYNMIFRWYLDTENNQIQAPTYLTPIYDFSDAWSNYHKANIKWFKDRNLADLIGSGYYLSITPAQSEVEPIVGGVLCFEDGNSTTVTATMENYNGQILTNSLTATVSIQASMT